MRVLRASLAAFLLLVGLAPAVFAATISMTTPYPSVVADQGTTVKFPVTVQTDTSTRVDLSVSQQPQGWTTPLCEMKQTPEPARQPRVIWFRPVGWPCGWPPA